MANEEDPRELAKQERKRPEVERMLRQFLSIDGPKGATEAYKRGYDAIDWSNSSRPRWWQGGDWPELCVVIEPYILHNKEGWFFVDETQSSCFGPLSSHDEALTQMIEYAKTL